MLRPNSASTRELTTQAQEGYSKDIPRFNRGGNNFMEGKPDMSPTNSQLTTPENTETFQEQGKRASAENKRATDIRALGENKNLPVEVRRTLEKIKQQSGSFQDKSREAMKNASLGDSERIDRATQLLKRNLTENQRKAILETHNQGKGEVGKDNGRAGIYNYTKGQLLKKVRILDEAGFSKEERRVLMEAGLVGDVIDRTLFTDVVLQGIVDTYMDALARAGGPGNRINQAVLMNQMRRVQELLDNPASGIDKAQGQTLLNLLNTNYVLDYPDRSPRVSQGEEGMYFALTETDKEVLDVDGVEAWVNQKMNILYEATKGQDASRHPLLQATENAFNDAIRYKQLDTEELRRLEEIFQTKERLIIMNSAFAVREMDQIIGAAAGLTAHRLFNGFNLDSGQVGAMFSRLAVKLEGLRVKAERGHITPEMIRRVQDDLIQEQFNYAVRGVGGYGAFYRETNPDAPGAERELAKARTGKGLFSKIYKEFQAKGPNAEEETRKAITRAEITRAVRASFDLFVSTQRLGVHMSRGQFLPGQRSYRAEPYSVFKIYNLEALEWKKFQELTGKDEELLRQMKLDMAFDRFSSKDKKAKGYDPKEISEKDLEEVGTRLVRDLFKIPDIFSSSWRIDAVVEQLDRLYACKQANGERVDEKLVKAEDAENMGLFFRLNRPMDEIWGKAGIPKDQRNAKTEEYRKGIWTKIAQYRPEEIIRLFRERDRDLLNGSGIDYDAFEEKYGGIVSILRNKAFSKGEQLDTWTLSGRDLADVDQALGVGEGKDLQEIYAKMRKFIEGKRIQDKYINKERSVTEALVEDDRFFDIYERTLLVDDALLGELENPSPKYDMVRLSEVMGIESSGDTLVRSMKDTSQAVKGGEILLKYLQTQNLVEKVKLSMEFADNTVYNGLSQRARAVRFTAGTALKLARSGFLWDVLGIQKAPFRQAISKYEKIYGPGVNPLSRDQLRSEVDQIGNYLTAAADNPDLETEKGWSEKQRAVKREERLQKANEVKHDLEKITGITAWDAVKRRACGLLLFLILSAFSETYQIGKEVGKEQVKA